LKSGTLKAETLKNKCFSPYALSVFLFFEIRKPITGERKKRNILQGVFQIFLISGLPNNPAFAFPQKPRRLLRHPAGA